MTLKLRYGMRKDPHDLNEVISSLRELSFISNNVATICLNTLAIAYRLRGEEFGSEKDINSAITIQQRVLALSGSSKLNQNELQGNLAVALLRLSECAITFQLPCSFFKIGQPLVFVFLPIL